MQENPPQYHSYGFFQKNVLFRRQRWNHFIMVYIAGFRNAHIGQQCDRESPKKEKYPTQKQSVCIGFQNFPVIRLIIQPGLFDIVSGTSL